MENYKTNRKLNKYAGGLLIISTLSFIFSVELIYRALSPHNLVIGGIMFGIPIIIGITSFVLCIIALNRLK
jgi:hypothetical protein